MSGILVLGLRILLTASLYIFIGWVIYLFWQDLNNRIETVSKRAVPALTVVLHPGEIEDARTFTQAEVLIGRDPTCSLSITHETVSAHHARLRYHHQQWWVEDMLSTNGTFLNQDLLNTPTVLTNGDDLRVGQVALKILMESKERKNG
jgi:hypothetical protein